MPDWHVQTKQLRTGAKVDLVVSGAPSVADARHFVGSQGFQVISVDEVSREDRPEHAIVQEYQAVASPPPRDVRQMDMLWRMADSRLITSPISTIALGVFLGLAAWFVVGLVIAVIAQ